jgi:hypothetical protein
MPVLAPLLRPEDLERAAPLAVTVTIGGTVLVPVLVVDRPALVVSNRSVLVLREDVVV